MWGEYIRGTGEENEEIVRGVLRLLNCERKRNSMLQLEHTADINNPFGFYTKAQTPLHVLAKMGLATICRRLLEDQQMFSNQTATGISVTATRIDDVDADSEQPKKVVYDVSALDGKGRTPLYEAAFNGHHEVVLILLKFGADPSARDFIGRTALHRAAKMGHDEVVKTLLAFQPALAAAKDCHEWSPLTLALHNGRTKTAEILLAACGIHIEPPNTTVSDTSVIGLVRADSDWNNDPLRQHLSLCLQLVSMFPNDHTFCHTLANCYWGLGQRSEAIKLFDVALSLFPSNVGVVDVNRLIHTNFCDHCDKTIVGLRYKCNTCRDYDLCSGCFGMEPRLHQMHEFQIIPSSGWMSGV